MSRQSGVHSVAFSPDGKLLASTGGDGSVTLWDTSTGVQERALRGHKDIVYDVRFDPEGRRLVTAGYDQTITLWDLSGTAEPLHLERPCQFRATCRLQPRRHADRLGELGPDDQALGRGQRPGGPDPARPYGRGLVGRLQPRRPAPGAGQATTASIRIWDATPLR